MPKGDGRAVTSYSSPDSLAFPSEWPAESVWRQKWLAALPVPERSRPMLATAEKGLLLRHPRAAATIGGHLREVQLQTRSASVGILRCGMLKYPGQSLPERMQAECQWRAGSGNCFNSFYLAVNGAQRASERVANRGALVAKFHQSGGYRPGSGDS